MEEKLLSFLPLLRAVNGLNHVLSVWQRNFKIESITLEPGQISFSVPARTIQNRHLVFPSPYSWDFSGKECNAIINSKKNNQKEYEISFEVSY